MLTTLILTRRRFLKIAAVGALGVASGAGAARAAPRRVRVTYHQASLGLTRPVRVVHLTDLHIGWGTPPHLLRQAVAHTLKARPHLVVLTGDYLNRTLKHQATLEQLVEKLPKPCVATLGNHDHWSGAAAIRRALEDRGVVVLQNRHEAIPLRGRHRRLVVVGVDDGFTKHHDVARALEGLRRPEQALVLTHDPDTADAIVQGGARLVLAGHTHGGQVQIPKVTRALSRLAGNRYLAGWYRVGRGRLYVNVGIGSSFIRWRAGRRAVPEVAVIDLS